MEIAVLIFKDQSEALRSTESAKLKQLLTKAQGLLSLSPGLVLGAICRGEQREKVGQGVISTGTEWSAVAVGPHWSASQPPSKRECLVLTVPLANMQFYCCVRFLLFQSGRICHSSVTIINALSLWGPYCWGLFVTSFANTDLL